MASGRRKLLGTMLMFGSALALMWASCFQASDAGLWNGAATKIRTNQVGTASKEAPPPVPLRCWDPIDVVEITPPK